MRYRKLGNSDLNCSVVGLGTWGMSGSWGDVDDNESIAAIHAAIDHGINLIDTAQPYGAGKSEEIVGKAIKGRRDKVIVATKCGSYVWDGKYGRNATREELRREIEGSLSRLGVDTIDLYQMHWPVYDTPFSESFDELNKMRQEGLIRHIGVSNFSPEEMDEVQKYCPLVSLQPPYALLDRLVEKEILPYCADNNIGTLTYGSICGGALTDRTYNMTERPTHFLKSDPRGRADGFYPYYSEEQWPKTRAMLDVLHEIAAAHDKPIVHVAINWVLKQRGVTVALCGAKTPEQVIMNAGAGDWELSDEENKTILDAYTRIYGDELMFVYHN